MNPRWLVLIVAVLVVLLIAPIVLLLLLGGQPSGSSAGPSGPVASASVQPGDGAIAFTDAGSPEDAAWYRHGGDPGVFPPHLQVGTMSGGVTFDAELHFDMTDPAAIVPQRPVLGVGDGVVVIVDDDGRHSALRAIVAATGDVHDLLISDEVIVNGALDSDGRVAYFVTADRLSGDLTGAWRLAVGEGGQPDAIEALSGAAPEIRFAAISRLFTRVLLSPDGTTLGLFRCVEADCALRAVRTDDGSFAGEVLIPRGGGDAFAITDELALLRPIAPEGPDRFGVAVDLASGERARIPVEEWPFGTEAVLQGADGPMLALQTAGWTIPPETMGQGPGDPPEVTLIGLDDLRTVATHALSLSSLSILIEDDYSMGVDLPPGWLLVWGSQPGELPMSAYAMSLADGSLVPLPAVGELVVQG